MAERMHRDESYAFELLAALERVGLEGAPRDKLCAELGWTPARFTRVLGIARDGIAPALGLTIPHPVPADEYRYRLTGLWETDDDTPAIAAGTAYAMAIIETRLRAVLRDVRVALGNLDRRSIAGRKCNLMNRDLTKMLNTLREIDGDA